MPPTQKKSGNPYRFSKRFLNLTTRMLLGILVVLLVVGFILGFLSDGVSGAQGEFLSDLAFWVIIASFGVPLLVAAVIGGEAIRRGGGIVGFLLIVGLAAAAAGMTEPGRVALGPDWAPIAQYGGIALIVLSIAGFWVIGFIAKVPMWIQAPWFGAPRRYIRRGDDPASRDRDA